MTKLEVDKGWVFDYDMPFGEDQTEAAARIVKTPQMRDEFNLNPDGFPGQDN